MRTLILFLLLAVCVGCHRSGTWADDSRNWERAFGEEQPKDIKVVHSSYYRSPHFTLEFVHFFQIEPSEEFRKRFNDAGKLKRFAPASANDEERIQFFFHDKPSWFIPKPLDRYEIWRGDSSDPLFENFRLFIDRDTGVMFITDYSV